MMTKKTILFLIVTFFLSWIMVPLFKLTGLEWNAQTSLFVTLPFMFTPLLSAIIVRKGFFKEKNIFRGRGLFRVNRWFIAAWIVMPVLAFATLGVSLLFPGIDYSAGMEGMLESFRGIVSPDQMEEIELQIQNSPIHPIWLALLQGLFAGITINAVAGFGEEFGWRELLFNETGKWGFWKSSLFTGAIWGIWHTPIILKGHNYPEHPVAGVFMMIIWCILLAPIFTYIRFKSKSVIAAAILHGTLNGTAGIAVMTVSGGSDLTRGMTGLAGFIVLSAVNLVLIFQTRREKENWKNLVWSLL